MSAVSEAIAREYFELLNYLVTQPRKYVVPGRQKNAEEEVDLVIFNPRVKLHRLPDTIVWTTQDLKNVARAIVGVRGWHTERFYASTFEQTPEILRFVEPESLRFASQILGSEDMAKILCLPRLPASGQLKAKTIEMLRGRGIDGVISFRTMLAELASRVDTNRNYEKSDLLQVIRLLKNYDFLKGDQLELFAKRRRRSPSKRKRTSSTDESKT